MVNDSVKIELPEDKGRIDDIIKYINMANLCKITVKYDENLKKDYYNKSNMPSYSLDFLKDIYELEKFTKLEIYCNSEDYSPIYRFTEIEELSINPPNSSTVDLSRFHKLRKLFTNKLSQFYNLDKSPMKWLCYGNITGKKYDCETNLVSQLKELEIITFDHVKEFPLEQLAELKNLKDLRFVQCGIVSLKGIEKLQSLEDISVDYCNKFAQVDGVELAPKLKVLWFDSCSKLKYMAKVAQMKNLKVLLLENIKLEDLSFLQDMKSKETLKCLMLSNCGNIESIKFIDNYPNLKALSCDDTNILDGDITPCLRLESASISNKRHYNLKDEQLKVEKGFYSYIGDED